MTIEEIRRTNLQTLVSEYGGVGKLAEVIGKDQSQLSQWINASINSGTGKPRGIRSSTCRHIEEKCGKPIGWLEEDHSIETVALVLPEIQQGYIRLDYLDIQSSAGHGKVADAYPPLIQNLNVLEDWALQSFGKNAVEKIKIINNSGDSMSPTIQDGDILFVDVSRRAFEAEGIYVLDWNGRLLTKRLVAQQDGRLAIISDNPSYQPEYINEKNIDSLVICGQVRGWWSFKRF